MDVVLAAMTPSGFVERDKPTPGAHIIDVAGKLVSAGLIDIQVNGGYGHDFTHSPDSIWLVGQQLVAHGVTAFLPTIVSASDQTIARAQQVITAGPPPLYAGVIPLGLHLEGPFFPLIMWAHIPRGSLRKPADVDTSSWIPVAGVLMVTLVPERHMCG